MLYRTQILDDSGVSRVLGQVDPILVTNPLKNVNEDKGIDPEWLDERIAESLQPELTLSSGRSGFTYKKYTAGQDYDWHQDEITSIDGLRLDVSTTLFLNDPTDYEGGELELRFGDFGVSIKLPAGYAVIYPTGIIHRVKPIISGVRKVVHWWDESNVQNPFTRDAIVQLSKLPERVDLHTATLERFC